MTKVRVKRVAINPEMFFQIMREGTAWRVTKGIPEGARLRGFTLDPYTTCLHLFVEHESFEEVAIDANVIPQLETFFKKI